MAKENILVVDDDKDIARLVRSYPEQPVGFWGVGLDGGEPELFTETIGIYSADMQMVAYPENGTTIVERVADGERWTIPNGGRSVSFSPDGELLAWTEGQFGPPFDTAQREVWISNVDGTEARQVAVSIGGGLSGWFPDGGMLLSGRDDLEDATQTVWVFSPNGGEVRVLFQAPRFRSLRISPDGEWLVYQVTFSENERDNGLWIANVNSGETQRLDLFGAFRWRSADQLLVIPLDLTSPNHHLWQVDAPTGEARQLTYPAVTPFKIANGDWTVSPDGQHIAFVSADDNNIWLLSLPS